MNLLAPAATYFALVFGAGFVFGTLRVLWVIPRLGVRTAELLELPLMLIVVVFAARWINRRFLGGRVQAARLTVGFLALAMLLAAEIVLGMMLRGTSPTESLLARDPVSGSAYYLSLLLFALTPWLLGRYGRSLASGG